MKKQSKGFTLVELLVVIGILGILMSVLVPQITNSMFRAKLSAMSKNGKDLIDAINGYGVAHAGEEDIWAHISEADGKKDDSERINGMSFSTATDYFKKVFDVENQTSSNWSPWIDKGLLSKLWGFGVPAAKAGSLNKANVAWTIVSGLPDGIEGGIPVMTTRNLDTAQFATTATTQMDTKKDVPSLQKYAEPFGKQGCIVVYKSGSVKTFEARDARLCDIYKELPTVSIPDGVTLKYLEP